MFTHSIWEPFRAFWTRKRLERMQYEAALRLFQETSTPERVEDEPDAADWQQLFARDKDTDETTLRTIRDKARYLADHNAYARNILTLYRNYTVGTGMRHEVVAADAVAESTARLPHVAELWRSFLVANDWDTGNRKDWEFCVRTWRDGECFLRMFRQPTWPPRVHFVDPEHIVPDPYSGEPSGGIETMPGNVEVPLAYYFVPSDHHTGERIEADRMLHTKIGVDGNVKRGASIFLPVMDALKRFQGWLDIELIHRKMAASIVLVRNHHQNYPTGVGAFADNAATGTSTINGRPLRRAQFQPGSILESPAWT